MANQDVERWQSDAKALPTAVVITSGLPVRDRVFEADGAAAFLRKRWKADPQSELPGMEVAESEVPLSTADDIESLARAIRALHNDQLFPSLTPSEVPAYEQRATELIRVLSNGCELVLDDGVHEPADDALAAAKALVTDDTRAARIEHMFALAEVADEVKPRLAALKDFDVSWIGEIRALAQKLSSEGPPVAGRPASPEIDLRNRLITLLDQRVSKVRRAAAYVYRDRPEVLRLVTSAYERQRRLEAKRKKAKKDEPT